MIRIATPKDNKAVTALCMKAAAPYGENLLLDPKGMAKCVQYAISSSASFVAVDSDLKSVIAVTADPMVWAERKAATISVLYAENRGNGIALLRSFFAWAKKRRDIKVISADVPSWCDPRVAKLYARFGLNNESRCMTAIR